MLRLRRWVHNPRIEITLAILTPFLAYWPPEHLGGSGVLATMTAGLYISWSGFRLISAATRLQGIFFRDLFIYLIEGMIFLTTGLQARTWLNCIGDYAISDLLFSALVVSVAVIAAGFIWVYPATGLPRWLFPPIQRKDPAPPCQWPFVLALTGVRGIVSLAAALATPFGTANGQPFPDRDLILFLIFAVILVTLVGQELLLPPVIRALGVADTGRSERAAERSARRDAIEAALKRLAQLAAERGLAPGLVQSLRGQWSDRLLDAGRGDEERKQLTALRNENELLLLTAEREGTNDPFCGGKLTDEARRRIERELDLREAYLNSARDEA